MSFDTIIQSITALAILISVVLIYKTMRSNEKLNRGILFSEVSKEERELKIKLQEYTVRLDDGNITDKEKDTIIFAYETLLFNYYEYLAICLYKHLIDEDASRLYFKDLLVSVKKVFKSSQLFKKELVKVEEYPGIQWLFKHWRV